jgi:hypothetical protein
MYIAAAYRVDTLRSKQLQSNHATAGLEAPDSCNHLATPKPLSMLLLLLLPVTPAVPGHI